MSNKFYVYKHIRLDTEEVFYVGKGAAKRAWRTKSRNELWYNIVNKAGYRVEIVKDNLSETESFELETKLIKSYRNQGLSKANMTDGGEGFSGGRHNEESRKKIGVANKRNIGIKRTKSTKDKISKSLEDNKLSKEHKSQISKSLSNKYYFTPKGRFDSSVEAAKAFNVKPNVISYRCKSTTARFNGWYTEEK